MLFFTTKDTKGAQNEMRMMLVALKTAIRLLAFGFRVAIQADMRGQNRLTFWVKSPIRPYRQVQQPDSRMYGEGSSSCP